MSELSREELKNLSMYERIKRIHTLKNELLRGGRKKLGFTVIADGELLNNLISLLPSSSGFSSGSVDEKEYKDLVNIGAIADNDNKKPSYDWYEAQFKLFFENVIFCCPINLKEKVLPFPVAFLSCSFQRATEFSNCQFCNHFYLDNCRFNSPLLFKYNTLKSASLMNCKFDVKGSLRNEIDAYANFEGLKVSRQLILGNNSFYQGARFDGSELRFIFARDLTFDSNLTFIDGKKSNIRREFSFAECVFQEKVDISGVTDIGGRTVIRFDDAEFTSNLSIVGAKKTNSYEDFCITHIAKTEIYGLSFVRCRFLKKALLGGFKILGEANFNSTSFLDGADFKTLTFCTAPHFHEAKFHTDTSFPDIKYFLDRSSLIAEKNYRTLRQQSHDKLSEDDVHKFRALELESRKRGNKKAHDEFFLSYCYKFINEYGLNLWRPLWLIILLWAITFSLYTGLALLQPEHYAGIVDSKYCLAPFKTSPLCYSTSAAFNSILGIFTFATIDIKSPAPANLVHYMTVVASSVLWFFFVLGIRRRFKI